MKNILVNGYFGVNFGDDLFFKILFERYPKVKFSFYNNSYLQNLNEKYKEIYFNYNNVEVKKYNKVRRVFEKLGNTTIMDKMQYSKYDGTVFIGGSIFMERPYWENSYTEKKNVINYFYEAQKPVFIIGSNFGPVKTDKFKSKYSELFDKCTDICFRDKYSYDLFSDKTNIRLAPDIVFQLKEKNVEKVKDTVGISVINAEHKADLKVFADDYNSKIKEIVEKLIIAGKKITFFSFCKAEGDEKAIDKIVELIDEKYKSSISIEKYSGDIDGFLEKFESMENIIGTRFHACILSQVFNQGLYPIIYSDKTYNVLKDIKLDKHYKYIKDINTLDVDELITIIPANKINNANLFKEAEEQFKGLDNYVGK